MSITADRVRCAVFIFAVVGLIFASAVSAQQTPPVPEIPDTFNLDVKAAARLRPKLIAESSAASGAYAIGQRVLVKLVAQAHTSRDVAWELRIVNDGLLNAYSSPDGTIYVESGLAELAGPTPGLWAALLSHEIAHIVRRDWARRYLYEKSLSTSGSLLVMGDPGLPAAGWADARTGADDFARFCRQMELDADREGLALMARAGYHPDFVPALQHLLHAQDTREPADATHPRWEERDRQLERAYVAASIDFAHRWLQWYASPGGNPPIVVFEDEPTTRKAGNEWEVQIPLRCENLAGAVEVVLQPRSSHNAAGPVLGAAGYRQRLPESSRQLRQLTGCTSPRTTVTFKLANDSLQKTGGGPWADVFVLDGEETVLSRAEVQRARR
ncbi:MAG TPA: M48 family metallopeptidase [Candidatus Sulfotelmatobacter sp.]|nr:M48 family metallopeptidase [Candidatus Sulfotelmatobacter sp.]